VHKGDCSLRHDRSQIVEELDAKLGSRLCEVPEKTYEKKKQREKCEQKIVRKLSCTSEDIVVLDTRSDTFQSCFESFFGHHSTGEYQKLRSPVESICW